MSGEGRFVVWGCTFECDRGHNYTVTYMPKRRDWDNQTCVYCREEDRDAEVARLAVICEEAGMQVGLLEREVARLTRGIEAYREVHECNDKETWGPSPECASCLWERDDEKRRESGDER